MKRVLILEVRRNSVCCFEDDFDVAKRHNVFKGFDQIIPHTERSCSNERQYQRNFHLRHCTGTFLSFVLLKKFKMHLSMKFGG